MPPLTISQAFELAVQHHRGGNLAAAEQLYRQILEVDPHHARSLHLLGLIAHQSGRPQVAIEFITKAIGMLPNVSDFHSNLGLVYRDCGRLDDAIRHYQFALTLEPNLAAIHYNLGIALFDSNQFAAAIAEYREAIRLDPQYSEAWCNLGFTLSKVGELDEAEDALHQALRLNPNNIDSHNNLAAVFRDQGSVSEAVATYRHVIALQPEFTEAYSNLLLTLHYDASSSAESLRQERKRWNDRYPQLVKQASSRPAPLRDPDRKLRIGYVSPDLRDHFIGRHILPLVQFHDFEKFEIFCYSGVTHPDAITKRFRKSADQWRETSGVSDTDLSNLIQQDQVDILVDLTQHMIGNRLGVFALQPAPVQVSYAGYPETTGLETIRYRISDKWLETTTPPHGNKNLDPRSSNSDLRSAEQVYPLNCFWFYDPGSINVSVNPLPAEQSGHITFGCLNAFLKTNAEVFKLWAKVLHAVNDSRLLILCHPGKHRQRVLDCFTAAGIDSIRIGFLKPQPQQGYFELYHHIDISLDPFPYSGHSTTLDGLWMGVPVITLAGTTPMSRGGVSILNNIGLPELIASNDDDYVAIAKKLTGDCDRLAELRKSLRSRLESSVIMDAYKFTHQIEATYRAMWRHWCAENA